LAVAAAGLIGDLDVVVIGGGAMGRAVVRQLDPSRVAVYSRRSQPVADIPSRPWEELPEALASCRAVVSTIPGPVPVLQGVQRLDGDPVILVDLGMPPAVEKPDPSALIYHGVDDVASSVPLATEPEAEQIVASEAEDAWRRLSVSEDARSIISSVVDLVDRTVDDEVRRFAHRLSAADEPESVLRQLAHNVARRIIHPSVSLLGSTPLTPADLDVMAKAFGVDRE
jgi:glutamyl-tRNA reductase